MALRHTAFPQPIFPGSGKEITMHSLGTVLPPPPPPSSEIISASAVKTGKEHRRSVGRLAKSGVYVLGAFMALALAAGQANGAQDAQAIQVAQAGRLDSTTQKKLNDALIEAAMKGNTAEVRRLLDGGANINAKDSDGDTALIHAARNGSEDDVRALLEKGANPNVKGYRGWTARDYGEVLNDSSIIQLLASKGGKSTGKGKARLEEWNAYQDRWAKERERKRKEACSHVYVGKAFKGSSTNGLDRAFGFDMTYKVEGFSETTGEVTASRWDSYYGEKQYVKFRCEQIPR